MWLLFAPQKRVSPALGLGSTQLVGLVRCAAALARLGDVFHGTNLDRLLRRTACFSRLAAIGSAARSCGCRTCRSSDFNLVADMLAQLRSISGQLEAATVLVSQRVVSARATQTAHRAQFVCMQPRVAWTP